MLTIKNSDIAKHLSLPPVKLHCSMLAEDAIKAAVRDIKARHAPLAVPPLPANSTPRELCLSGAAPFCCHPVLQQTHVTAGARSQKQAQNHVMGHCADASTAVVQAKRNAAVTPSAGTEAFAGAAAS